MSLRRAQVVVDIPKNKCLKHGAYVVRHYCKQCTECGCQKCMQTKHKSHNWCDIGDVASEKEKELLSNIDILESTKLPELREIKHQIQKRNDAECIDRRAELMIDEINEYRKLLKSKDAVSNTNQKMKSYLSDCDTDIEDLEQLIRTSRRCIAMKSKPEIVQGNENLKIALSQVEKSSTEFYESLDKGFQCPELDVNTLHRLFGSFQDENITSEKEISEEKMSLKLTNQISTGRKPIRIFSNEENTYVGECDTHIEIFNIKGRQTRKVPVDFESFTVDDNKNIFCCRFMDMWISEITADGNIIDIDCTYPYYPYDVCRTSAGDLFVVLVDVLPEESETTKNSLIVKMDVFGREKQRFEYDKDGSTRLFRYPFCVETNKNSDLLVLDRTAKSKARLYILDKDGIVLNAYNGTSQLDGLFSPLSVCCDDKCRILVGDVANEIIHLLNEKGLLLQLLTLDNVPEQSSFYISYRQNSLWIAIEKGEVLVADYKSVKTENE